MTNRPTWEETWLDVATVVSRRSLCVNSSVGAVVVTHDQRLNSTGYNGPPRGLRADGPCTNWCERARGGSGSGTADYSACASIHAEVNALLRADATEIQGGTLYLTRAPCINCARVVANSGLSLVLCRVNEEDNVDKAMEVFGYLAGCGIDARYYQGRTL